MSAAVKSDSSSFDEKQDLEFARHHPDVNDGQWFLRAYLQLVIRLPVCYGPLHYFVS